MPEEPKKTHNNQGEKPEDQQKQRAQWQAAELKPQPTESPEWDEFAGGEPTMRIPVQQVKPAEPTVRIPVQPKPQPQPSPTEQTPPPAEPTRRFDVPPQPTDTTPGQQPKTQKATSGRPQRLPPYQPTPQQQWPPASQQRPDSQPTTAQRQQYPPQPPQNAGQWEPTQQVPLQQKQPQRVPTQTLPAARVQQQPRQAAPPPRQPPARPRRQEPALKGPEGNGKGSGATLLLWVTLGGIGLFFVGLVAAMIGYVIMASQLPSPDELRAREPTFASSQIYDRDKRLLYEIIDPTTGKRTYVGIEQIAKNLQYATVATEDRNFYTHGGFDPIAIIRAIYYALQEREIVSGASTITQQVARNILLPEERTEISASRKIKEIILAAELTRKYSKDEILEIYLNNNNYGNLAYGIDAAARTYFGTSASNLSLGQAAFLAGIPQAPTLYDPYGGGHDAALKRQKTVLGLMVEDGYISQEQADAAAAEMDAYPFTPIYGNEIPAPHFVMYVRQWVEKNLGADMLYQGSGLRIHTTLDPRMQSIAEEEIANGVNALANLNVSNGALIALEPATGNILAMVGSADFYSELIDGQVNLTQRCRQPGSAIKPLTYLTAFEKGWNPSTVVWDLPKTYTDTAGNIYQPVNYDGTFRGPTSIRRALANSLNIPAVKTLEFVTVNGLLEMADRLGATSLVSPQLECPDYPYDTRPLYGLALTLGGGEMKPVELAAAYATLGNGGEYLEPNPISWIEDNQGNIILDYRDRKGEQVVKPQHAYLITNILADTQARCEVFNCPSILELPDRPVAAKTGTTNDNRDAWTAGYTPDIAAVVWVGNNDNSPMFNVGGSSGAAPIWNAFMRRAHEGIPAHPFPEPQGIVEREVCSPSGVEASPYCPEKRSDIFYREQPPLDTEYGWFQLVQIDGNSGLRANEICTTNIVEKIMIVLESVTDPDGRKWLEQWAMQNGYEIAPAEYCAEGFSEAKVQITKPLPGEAVAADIVEIRGTVDIPDFDHYEITYGLGNNPQGWGWVSGPHEALVRKGLLGLWDARGQEPGVYTIRVVAFNQRGAQFEQKITFALAEPTPTPTPEVTETLIPTDTPIPTIILPTDTPTLIPTVVPPTNTLPPTISPPTLTPTPEPPGTEEPSPIPTEPPTLVPIEITPSPTTEAPTPAPTEPITGTNRLTY